MHGQEERRQRRRIECLIFARVLQRLIEIEDRRDPSPRLRDVFDALDRRRRHGRDPQAAIAAEALLRCEVVDVEVRRVDPQTGRP